MTVASEAVSALINQAIFASIVASLIGMENVSVLFGLEVLTPFVCSRYCSALVHLKRPHVPVNTFLELRLLVGLHFRPVLDRHPLHGGIEHKPTGFEVSAAMGQVLLSEGEVHGVVREVLGHLFVRSGRTIIFRWLVKDTSPHHVFIANKVTRHVRVVDMPLGAFSSFKGLVLGNHFRLGTTHAPEGIVVKIKGRLVVGAELTESNSSSFCFDRRTNRWQRTGRSECGLRSHGTALHK
jgi:hypothetical protein